MTSPVVLAVATLNHKSGIPKDADQNSFVFTGEQTSPLNLAFDLISKDVIHRFYDVNSVGAHPLSYYLSSALNRTGTPHLVEYYDITSHLDGSPHGTPITYNPFGMSATVGSAVDLPAENGAVITIHDNLWGSSVVEAGSTRPKQRHAGRLYIGPLNAVTIGTDVLNGECRLVPGFTADLGAAATQIGTDVGTISVPTYWAHWSRTLANVYEIVGGHVDNEVDIQRRRGLVATARSPWVV